MKVHEFIDQLFSRPAIGVAANMRRITRPQLDLLCELVGEDEEGSALQRGTGLSFVWMPSGRHKYVVTEDVSGDKHTIARLSNLRASDCGRLF